MSSDAAHFAASQSVSRETLDRLCVYEALLKKWNAAINLVSPQTLTSVWTRHFLDSAQLFSCPATVPRHWADLGSGGGFPGLVVAALAQEKAPEMKLTLVESDKRKAAFLMTALREMGLRATVLASRIESLPPLEADVLSARALAPLDQLLGFAQTHLVATGEALFPKGQNWNEEVAQAREAWSFDCETQPSITQNDAVILKIKGLKRA